MEIKVGDTIGLLTILEKVYHNRYKTKYAWKCQCKCGKIVQLGETRITKKGRRSCGCIKANILRNIEGEKFGRLTPLYQMEKKAERGKTYWMCRCDCGKEVVIKREHLRSRKSCGCIAFDERYETLVGREFKGFEVIEQLGYFTRKKTKDRYYKCICKSCKKECVKSRVVILSQAIKSCGCLSKNKTFEEKKIYYIYRKYCDAAKYKNREFELSVEDLGKIIKSNCHYCNKPPSQSKDKNLEGFLNNGIDRIDNELGYNINNTVPCCNYCNKMKFNMKQDMFLDKITQIYNWSVKQNEKD